VKHGSIKGHIFSTTTHGDVCFPAVAVGIGAKLTRIALCSIFTGRTYKVINQSLRPLVGAFSSLQLLQVFTQGNGLFNFDCGLSFSTVGTFFTRRKHGTIAMVTPKSHPAIFPLHPFPPYALGATLGACSFHSLFISFQTTGSCPTSSDVLPEQSTAGPLWPQSKHIKKHGPFNIGGPSL